eukprot:CAMPEP_0201979540 /NCGR_PEP_ID=MMETSP0904-20121228/67627_1 /ASSEMBLY_ACC=CAM_ASM_000553 /TAXON_ID=420261 /ORGANISM="Thalassiosira antarctica, Strain CCMP982" /LENGTH=50 /DNA_ID=CAMNT_0048531597 /DNA_START=96 /DNA_END=245 /DNA_ORIENTATION=+
MAAKQQAHDEGGTRAQMMAAAGVSGRRQKACDEGECGMGAPRMAVAGDGR